MLARNLGDFLRPTFFRWVDENNKTPWKPKANFSQGPHDFSMLSSKKQDFIKFYYGPMPSFSKYKPS
jgi:hypothetical protein